MKINCEISTFLEVIAGKIIQGDLTQVDHALVYDSRKIYQGSKSIFIALKSNHRDGHQFIGEAYNKGIRLFLIDQTTDVQAYEGAVFIHVADVLKALQSYAKYYRKQLNYPLIAITGSYGKTMVKEWLYELLSIKYKVQRSPKSYNSQLGVALSLLNFDLQADFGLVEVGISEAGEMEALAEMVQPEYGIFTSFGTAHRTNFKSEKEHFAEKMSLFKGCQFTFFGPGVEVPKTFSALHQKMQPSAFQKELSFFPYTDAVHVFNATIAIGVASYFKVKGLSFFDRIKHLPSLAMRLETFEGKNQSLVIHDAYHLDTEAFVQSLAFQVSIAGSRDRIVIIGMHEHNSGLEEQLTQALQSFQPIRYEFLYPNEQPSLTFDHSVVLLKGTRKAGMERLINFYRLKKHQTYIEIDLSAIKHNIEKYRAELNPGTKMMAMVKADAYGSGQDAIPLFLENLGIPYFGVAYADEGIALRKLGVKAPILVMNAEEDGFSDCIQYALEPAIYAKYQLDQFIKELIFSGKTHFPIHLKLETGMHRLGFEQADLPEVLALIKSQPEVYVKGVYSHLAESDNRRDRRFSELQINRFQSATKFIYETLGYAFDRHILNSEGIINYGFAQFDMVRIGIGMYGLSNHPAFKNDLKAVFKWKSSISQIKKLKKGDSVGYNRSFIASETKTIAIVPVGYADGFKRSLSQGKGGVYWKQHFCPTLGNVCMDMIMIDVSGLLVNEGDEIEIIGGHQSLLDFANQTETIPYEVLTSISKRVHRVYLQD